ncbi:MAG TPA: hypothetical protein VM534_02830 [Thermoanaerobaculia bacterium]|nr:hypothetical protein [Thermoanaerobaculia bacterium]
MMRRVGLVVLLGVVVVSSGRADCGFSARVSLPYRETVHDVWVVGEDLWVATSTGVVLYDRSTDPPAPRAGISLPDLTRRVRASADHAWVASGTRLFRIDRQSPSRAAGSIDLGSTIFDLHLLDPYLYAATGNGVVQIDLFDPVDPFVNAVLQTGTGRA